MVNTVITADNISTTPVYICAQSSSDITQRLCSHARVNKWIVAHFQPNV